MKVDGSLKSLLQGVSQQPPRDRLPGQATLQVNMSSDPITGLTRRPPTDLVGPIVTTANLRAFKDFKTRDGQKFLAIFHDGVAAVVDLNATFHPVTLAPSTSFIITTPGEMKFCTDKDDVYVVNRGLTPRMNSGTQAYLPTTGSLGIIEVLGGAYGRAYTVKVNGAVVATYNTPDGSVATHAAQVGTTYIAETLFNLMVAALGSYSVVRRDDVIMVSGPTFQLSVNDDAGNVNMKCCTDSVTGVEDLPRLAPHLMAVRIAENADTEKDLWFKFMVEGQGSPETPDIASFGYQGYWQETVAPGVPVELDQQSMPHKLSYDPVDGFSFSQITWERRKVGTTVSNPDPSFIGNPIQDVNTFQGRLALISGSSVSLSRTNRYNDYFFGTVSAQAATDPIDVAATADGSLLQCAVQHNRDLVVFSTEGQFVLFGRTLLTPDNAALVKTSSFEAELNAHPVPAGRNVFFGTNYGEYTGIREFFTEGNSDVNDSRPITQHVKKYIDGTIRQMATSSNYDILLVQTDGSLNKVYPYQFIWSDTDKVQSSWHTWEFTHPVVYMFFDEELVYFVHKIGNLYYMTRMSLDVQDTDNVGYSIFLDKRFDVFDAYTQFLIPDGFYGDDALVVVQGENCPNPGLTAEVDNITDGIVTLKRNMLGGDLICGARFRSAYRPTMPIVKDADGVAVATGNLRLKSMLVSLSQTGFISGQVLSQYGDGPAVEFNGRIVGDIDNVVGVQPIVDYTFELPIRQSANLTEAEFSTTSHLPMTMLDIEWVGQYNKRGKRISTG